MAAPDSQAAPVAGIDLKGAGRDLLIERPRLSERLSAVKAPLIMLEAPAGYGKSVLLAQWAVEDPRPFTSIMITAAHNDPALLLASLIEAVEPVEPLPRSVAATIRTPQPDIGLVTQRLGSALQARKTELVLVLDELEHLQSEDSLRILQMVLSSVPAEWQVAMACRRRPQIHAARLLASSRLEILDQADVAMTRLEARKLLGRSSKAISEAEMDLIVDRAEGWPAALHLITLSRQRRPGIDPAEDAPVRDERSLVEYLHEEFLESLDPDDADFLIGASLLDRIHGDLCDHVLERTDSRARLIDLSTRNMLVIPLDREGEWFRLHSLLSEILRQELAFRRKDELPALRARASDWWEAAGDSERAIDLALEGGDFRRAGRLIWDSVPAFNTTGRYATLLGWIERIGLETATLDPHLSLTVAHGFLASGDGGSAEYWGEVTRTLLGTTPDPAPDLQAGLAMIDATLARRGMARMAADARAAGDSLMPDNPWQSMADLMTGVAEHMAGNTVGARQHLDAASRRAAVWGVPLIETLALGQLALIAAEAGDWGRAGFLASRTRTILDQTGLTARPSIATASASCAYVTAVTGRRETAWNGLTTSRQLLAELQDFGAWFEIQTALSLAATALELDRTDQARELAARAAVRLSELSDAPMLARWLTDIESRLSGFDASGLAELTAAEFRILRMLPSHLSHRQIAERFVVSPNTVKTQLRSIYRKLGVTSRHEAVEVLFEHEVVSRHSTDLRSGGGGR